MKLIILPLLAAFLFTSCAFEEIHRPAPPSAAKSNWFGEHDDAALDERLFMGEPNTATKVADAVCDGVKVVFLPVVAVLALAGSGL